MKRSLLLLTLAIFLCFSRLAVAQSSHLSLIYDFNGNDFDYYVKAMIGTNDSLYIISNTPDGRGIFFRIDEKGEGYKVIWEFDEINWAPNSLIGNDTVIYGTTRFSANHGGAIFKYSLKDHSFEFVKDFDPLEVQEVQVTYITDSVLWCTSQWSFVDDGSIFTINPDGTGFKKIYNDTDLDRGQNPVDFVFHEGKIYIACYNGGGTPYPDGVGGFVSAGSFIRINADGTGYEKIVPGGDAVGTQPQSLIIRENKLFGLFAYYGSHPWSGGQFFRSNLDGTEYEALGGLDNRALTRMLSTDSLIYGISSHNVFGINPVNGEVRIFDDLESNPDFGNDVCANPAYLNGNVYITAQQGGPNRGGTILKWVNSNPEVNESYTGGRVKSSKMNFDLNKLFTDPEGDLLTFKLKYDAASVVASEKNGVLTVTPLVNDVVEIEVTATDGWTGRKSTTITLDPNETVTGVDEQEPTLFLYPNPVHSVLNISRPNVQSIEILGIDGKTYGSFREPRETIDVNTLPSGIYFVRSYINGNCELQKIVKY